MSGEDGTKKRFKYDIVADQILDEIKTGRWKVGDKLPPEAKLVEEFGISRVCLRESLKKLNVLGILRIIQGDGTYVNEISPEKFMKPLFSLMAVSENNIEEIYDARIFVESGACQLAAERRSKDDIIVLGNLIDKMDESILICDYVSFSKYDRRFHDTITKFSDNQILVMIVGMFKEIIAGYTQSLNSDSKVVEKSMLDHRQLFWAISEADGEFARQIMTVHLRRSCRTLLEMVGKK